MSNDEEMHTRWQFEQRMRAAERAHDRNADFALTVNEAVVNNANIALRTALIINGGAAIALLGFISSLYTKDGTSPDRDFAQLAEPLMWFAWGVALAGVAIALAYFTNYCIVGTTMARNLEWDHPYVRTNPASKRWLVAAYIFQGLAIAAGTASLVFFILGMLEIKAAITSFL